MVITFSMVGRGLQIFFLQIFLFVRDPECRLLLGPDLSRVRWDNAVMTLEGMIIGYPRAKEKSIGNYA